MTQLPDIGASGGRSAMRLAVAACVIVAIARVVLALVTPAPDVVFDAAGYDAAARRLLATGELAYVPPDIQVDDPAPNAVVLPGYPVFLAGVYAASGTPASAQPVVSVAQALLSALTLWGVFLIARRIGGDRAGVMAVMLGAAYPPLWWSYRFVLTEDLFTAACVWTGWALVGAVQRPDERWRWAVVGLMGGLATLVRASGGAWLALAGLVLLAAYGRERRRIAVGGVIVVLAAVAVMTPWWVRNAGIYGRFVPLNSMTSGAALTQIYPDKEDLAEALAPFVLSYKDPSEELRANEGLGRLTRRLQREAIAADPWGFAWSRVRPAVIAVLTYHPNPFGGFSGWGGVVEAVHLAVLALAGFGAVRWWRRPEAWVLAALPATLLVAHTATLVFSRYLFPAMPFAIILAAGGAAHLAGLHRRASASRTPAGVVDR